MVDFKKFEKLSKTEYGIIRHLIVEEGLVNNSQIEPIIEQVTNMSCLSEIENYLEKRGVKL